MAQIKKQIQDKVKQFKKVIVEWEQSDCVNFIEELLLTHPELLNDIDLDNGFIKI